MLLGIVITHKNAIKYDDVYGEGCHPNVSIHQFIVWRCRGVLNRSKNQTKTIRITNMVWGVIVACG